MTPAVLELNNVLTTNLTLETKRLILRPFSLDDADDIYEYASDKEVVKYLTWEIHENKDSTLEIVKNLYLSKSGMFAIETKEEGKCIGTFHLRVDIHHNKASFGYVLNRNYWNMGYMSETLSRMIEYCFTELGLNRIEASHYLGNEKSGQVMLKCAMRFEGMAKQQLRIKNKYFDVLHYGLLKSEWENNLAK